MPAASTIEVPGYKPGVMQQIPGPSPELALQLHIPFDMSFRALA